MLEISKASHLLSLSDASNTTTNPHTKARQLKLRRKRLLWQSRMRQLFTRGHSLKPTIFPSTPLQQPPLLMWTPTNLDRSFCLHHLPTLLRWFDAPPASSLSLECRRALLIRKFSVFVADFLCQNTITVPAHATAICAVGSCSYSKLFSSRSFLDCESNTSAFTVCNDGFVPNRGVCNVEQFSCPRQPDCPVPSNGFTVCSANSGRCVAREFIFRVAVLQRFCC